MCTPSLLSTEVNSGFLFAGDELTRGTLLRCWPEVLLGPIVDATNGICSVTENIVTSLLLVGLWGLRCFAGVSVMW